MKKTLFVIFAVSVISYMYTASQTFAMPNPWIDCKDDISCGAKKAGFNLPIKVEGYTVRAMDGILEIKFPLDKNRTVTLRKSETYEGIADSNGIGDIPGVYENFPVIKTVTIKDGIQFNVKGDKKYFYVANFAAETGYYSFYCKEGFKTSDINKFYELLKEAEAPRFKDDEKGSYSIEELQKMRRIDGIVEPVYTQDCFPRTLQKKGVTKNCFERANLGEDSACSASEVKLIKEYYKKGYKKDPLNGCKDFCVKE